MTATVTWYHLTAQSVEKLYGRIRKRGNKHEERRTDEAV